jgi:hypothetical protein
MAASKPTVFLLSLDHLEYFDSMYDNLITQLSNKANVQRAKKSDAAVRYLSSNTPAAIIATDPAVAKSNAHPDVLQLLQSYVANGGHLIFACQFSSFITPPQMNSFWTTTFSKPWTFGDYHRTDVHLQAQTATALGAAVSTRLPQMYSQKAVFLKNVRPAEALYGPTPDSRTQSAVFPPGSVDQSQIPVVWAQVGQGWLGYVGDVNGEKGSDAVVLAMCGL